MTTYEAPPHQSTRPQRARPNATHQALGQWLADLLMLDQARPRRCARMSTPGETKYDKKAGRRIPRDKYEDIPKGDPFTLSNLIDHARASVTWACTLDQNGLSYAGVIEIDAGGRDALLRTLAACERRGIIAFAFEQIGTDHKGGHVWALFSEPAPAADILALCRAIAADAGLPDDTELWPQNQALRPPFGFHQRNQTRGNLLLQSGELIALDTELAAGFAAVYTLPRNSAPPAAPVELKPERAAPKALTLAQRPAGRASLDDVKARFAAEHTLESLLEHYGAEETKDGYTCPFCTHTHQTTLYIGKLGRLFSYSPNCTLHTTKGWDAFGLYVKIEHNDNVVAAARALNPIAPRQRQPEPTEPERRQQTPAQAADAARKRAQRQEARAARFARIDELCGQLDSDPRIYPFARDVFAYHISCWSENPEHFGSVERIARAVLTLDRTPTESEARRVQLAHQRLIEAGYLLRTVRTDPGRKNTNCWQPGQADGDRVIRAAENAIAHQEAENDARITLIESSTDLIYSNSRTSEGGAQAPEPPALGEPDTLDTWQALCDEHGADELAFLDEPTRQPEPTPAPPLNVRALPEGARIVRPKHGPYCWASFGELTGPSRPRTTPDALLIADAWGLWDAMQPVAPLPDAPAQTEARPEIEPAGPGASYCAPMVEPSGAYTGQPKQYADFAQRWAWSNEAIQPLWNAETTAHILDLHDPRWAEQEDPLIRTAPIEPEARAQYFALRAKAKKVTSPKQRRWLDKQADALMIWQPTSEAQARREQAATVRDAPASQARAPQARPAKTSQAHQAQLFGGAQ